MKSPYFSIVIPTLNEEQNLPILLSSIDAQTDKDFEVIVSDSGSTDNTKQVALEYKNRISQLLVISNKVKTVAAARNFGASVASGTFLIFFDADVEIEHTFLKQVRDHITKNNLDILSIWNRVKKGKLSGKIIFALLNIGMSLFQKIQPLANGPCMIMKRELFEKVKGFDETIFFAEDYDLMKRIGKLHIRFAAFSKPILYVSPRRFEQEGLLLSLYKSGYAMLYQLFVGPIRKPIFNYEMGGHIFKR